MLTMYPTVLPSMPPADVLTYVGIFPSTNTASMLRFSMLAVCRFSIGSHLNLEGWMRPAKIGFASNTHSNTRRVHRSSRGSLSRSDSSPVMWSNSASVSITDAIDDPRALFLGKQFWKRRYLGGKVGARVQQRPFRARRADRDRALRPRLRANRPGPQPPAITAVAIPLREAASRRGAKHMDPHKMPGL